MSRPAGAGKVVGATAPGGPPLRHRPLSRRRLLQAGVAAGAAATLARRWPDNAAVASPAPGPPFPVHPRAGWGADLPPAGPLAVEDAADVRFLLVHHSASPNDYPAGAVAGQIRSFFRLHTGPARGWPDVAYNFFVDRFGDVWEGRQGSLDAPVKGDATGGSQGYALLCCFIGDHRSVPPTAEAQSSMVALLGWLAGRYGIDPTPGATTRFVSRGSNRWPAGAEVVTATIAGHRDMSRTACPGDAAYRLVRHEFPARVAALVAPAPATSTSTTGSPAATTSTATTTTTLTTSTPAPTTTTAMTSAAPPGDDGRGWLLPAGGAAAALVAAALIGFRRRPARP